MRIALVTGSRADWQMIEPLLAAASHDADIHVRLLVTGTHLSARHGNTVDHIEAAGWTPAARVPIVAAHDTPLTVAQATGRAVTGLAEALSAAHADWVVVSGDRYESFAAGLAATMLAIPLAHIAGGETDIATNQDCNLRNALSKLAQLHFVAHEPAAARLRALGEEPHRIHITGLPSIDALRAAVERPHDLTALGLPAAARPFVLASFLPVTLNPTESLLHLHALLDGLARRPELPVIFVLSNGDARGDEHDAAVRAWAAQRPAALLVTDLPAPLYHAALQRCAAYIGNSSSGVIETPYYGTPAIIVGRRQDGRPRAQNVRDVPRPTAAALAAALSEQLQHGPYPAGRSPWGDGHAAPRILTTLRAARNNADLMFKRLAPSPLERPDGAPAPHPAAELHPCESSR
jgi:UDP-hydrolysing UDP-N-acetyl-D-glucosamine 2-epimerase